MNEYDAENVVAGCGPFGGAELFVIEPTDKPFTCKAKTTTSVRVTDEHPQYKNVKDTQEGSVATLNGVCYNVTKVTRCNTGNLELVDISMEEK